MMPRLSRIYERSLSIRLLLFAGVTIAAALTIAWLVLGVLFERHLERQLQAELERHGVSLIAALEQDVAGRPFLTRQPADPRFGRPASGLYWRVAAPTHELRSRSLWDGELPPLDNISTAGWTAVNAGGAFEADVLAIGRRVQVTNAGAPILVEVAADRRPVAMARKAFGRETAIFLSILWLALAVAAWVQVRLGLQPLSRVRRDVEAMAKTPGARLPEERHPQEVLPLTTAINHFADRRAEDVERARRRARDLAHAFKTPITALRLQIEALDKDKAQDMTQSLSLLTGAVESELARTDGAIVTEKTSAAVVVARLWKVLARTPDGARLELENHVPADLLIPMPMEAALEAFGALLENAARHSASRIKVEGGFDNEQCWITLSDDGPGIADGLRDVVLNRGVRLDERGTRHGLGLSIAQDFIEASGGRLSLETADGQGLCVRLTWPCEGMAR